MSSNSQWQHLYEKTKAELDAVETQEEKRKNRDFVQVYRPGWSRIRDLMKKNPAAAGLYAFLAENIDSNAGAVVASQDLLAKHLGVTTRTIRRHVQYLEEEQALVKIPVQGRLMAYALHPHEVWRGYNNGKRYAAFNTKTLADQSGEIRRKLKAMLIAEGHDLDDLEDESELRQDELDFPEFPSDEPQQSQQ